MSYEIKIRKWLWIGLIIVIVLGGSFIYWYIYGNKTAVIPKTSPTPTKSATISPMVSANTTSSTSGKTSPPSATSTPSTIPTGWKAESFTVSTTSGIKVSYSVYIKNEWIRLSEGPTGAWYGRDQLCNRSNPSYSGHCIMTISLQEGTTPINEQNYLFFTTPDEKGYVTITFPGAEIVTAGDRKIIQDSFKMQ